MLLSALALCRSRDRAHTAVLAVRGPRWRATRDIGGPQEPDLGRLNVSSRPVGSPSVEASCSVQPPVGSRKGLMMAATSSNLFGDEKPKYTLRERKWPTDKQSTALATSAVRVRYWNTSGVMGSPRGKWMSRTSSATPLSTASSAFKNAIWLNRAVISSLGRDVRFTMTSAIKD